MKKKMEKRDVERVPLSALSLLSKRICHIVWYGSIRRGLKSDGLYMT